MTYEEDYSGLVVEDQRPICIIRPDDNLLITGLVLVNLVVVIALIAETIYHRRKTRRLSGHLAGLLTGKWR